MIGDIVSKATVVFDADTKALKLAIKDLVGEEKKLAEQQLAQSEARNKQLDAWKEKLATVSGAAGIALVAGKALWEGWEHNARKAQLATNVTTEQVERLRKGFGGLRSEMQSLEAANTLAQSKFKLTGDQMEMVGKAMRQLVREGHDWEEVNKKVTESFVKLNGGGLDDFGIHVADAKTEAEKFNVILEAMAEKSGKLGDNTKTSAEQMASLKTRFMDAMDAVKQSLGEIAVALLPVVEGIANIVGFAGKLVNMIPGGFDTIVRFIPGIGHAKNAIDVLTSGGYGSLGSLNTRGYQDQKTIASGLGPMMDTFGGNMSMMGSGDNPFIPKLNLAGAFGEGFDELNRLAYIGLEKSNAFLGETAELAKKAAAAAKKAAAARDKMWNKVIEDMLDTGSYYDRPEVEATPWDYENRPDMSISAQPGIDSSLFAKYGPGGVHDAQAYNAFQSSKLEGIFGPLSDFDAYRTAFDTLNGAIGSAFGAWIDGSQSAGEAFKKFIGEALKGVAVQMAMEAVKHGAYAIGNLAFGNFAGAAQHGKAAAAFAAGAVVIGGAAKALHSGGGGASPGAAAPGGGVPAYGGNSNGGSQQGSHTTVYYGGPDLMGSSDRQRMLAAKRITNAARVSNAGVDF